MKNGSIGAWTARVVAVCFALLLAPKIALAGEGVDAAADAAASCTTSATCAFPTPYCSATLHACVQCTSNRNCDGGLVCDVAHGVCRTCNGDADCPSATPYCDLTAGACIECVTDGNCSEGEKCAAGKCGSCGDGICGRSELLEGIFFGDPGSYSFCPQDCAKLCPQHDLKSALGPALLAGNFRDERTVFPPSCSSLDSAPNVVIGWQAPHAGDFYVTVSGTPMSIGEWAGGCMPDTPNGGGLSCNGGGTDLTLSLMEGDTVTFVLTPTVEPWGAYTFGITDRDPLCDGGNCPTVGTGGPTTNPVSDAAAASAAEQLCLDNAQMRHDDMCAGVECACAHCPQDYDDCHVVPGCGDITDCMTEKHCVGADCYISGQCRSVVDTYGGLAGPAFRAASGLQSCSLSLGCGLPCADAGSTSTPATKDAGALDAGPVCAAGRMVECPCEGGVTGTKQCLADGSGFKACVCGEPPLTPVPSGGCKCRMGATAPHDGGAAGALAVLALGLLRRRSRRSAEGT